MNFTELREMWAEDAIIDDTDIKMEAIKIPQLHSKYLNYYSDITLTKEKLDSDLKLIWRQLYEYYNGIDPTNCYQQKILKGSINDFIESDKKYIELKSKIKYYEAILSFLSEVIRNINNRSFAIKNYIEARKFENGEF